MFEVLRSITGGHEPGEVKPPEAFAGCDVDWLVSAGAIKPVDGFVLVKDGPLKLADDTAAEVEELHLKVIELEDALKAVTAERDALTARVAELEAAKPSDPAPGPDATKPKKTGK